MKSMMNDLELIQTDPIKLRIKTNMRQPHHKQGAKLQQRPIYDPVAIVNEAMRERSIALGKFVRGLVPSWEVLGAGVILALALVVIWVCWR